MSKVYIFDYQTDGRGGDCLGDYFPSWSSALHYGMAHLRAHVPDAVSWSVREIDEDTDVESVVERGIVERPYRFTGMDADGLATYEESAP